MKLEIRTVLYLALAIGHLFFLVKDFNNGSDGSMNEMKWNRWKFNTIDEKIIIILDGAELLPKLMNE